MANLHICEQDILTTLETKPEWIIDNNNIQLSWIESQYNISLSVKFQLKQNILNIINVYALKEVDKNYSYILWNKYCHTLGSYEPTVIIDIIIKILLSCFQYFKLNPLKNYILKADEIKKYIVGILIYYKRKDELNKWLEMVEDDEVINEFPFKKFPSDIKKHIMNKLSPIDKANIILASKELTGNVTYSQQDEKYILETKFVKYLNHLNEKIGSGTYSTIFIEKYIETTENIQVIINWYGYINMDDKEEEKIKIIIYKNGNKSRFGFLSYNCTQQYWVDGRVVFKGPINPIPFMKLLESEISIAKNKWNLLNIKLAKYNSNYNTNETKYIEIMT